MIQLDVRIMERTNGMMRRTRLTSLALFSAANTIVGVGVNMFLTYIRFIFLSRRNAFWIGGHSIAPKTTSANAASASP